MQKVRDASKSQDVVDPKVHDTALEAAMRASLSPYERAELLLLVEIGKRLDILTVMVDRFMPKDRK